MHEKVDHLPTQNLKYKQTSGTSNNNKNTIITIINKNTYLTVKFVPSNSVQCIPFFEVISVKCYSTSKQKYVAQ